MRFSLWWKTAASLAAHWHIKTSNKNAHAVTHTFRTVLNVPSTPKLRASG